MPAHGEPRNFWQWLRQQVSRDDAIGDLARDAIHDTTFPRRARRESVIRDYLYQCNACEGAHTALSAGFREWRRSTVKQ